MKPPSLSVLAEWDAKSPTMAGWSEEGRMGCWICRHQVNPRYGDPVGTCSDCWIHACDDHGERLAGAKFRCAVNTARISYANLVFADPDALPLGAALFGGKVAAARLPDGRGSDSALWQHSVAHRDFWRDRIELVLARASSDPNSPWFGRPVPRDERTLIALADLIGLVAWYLGLAIGERYPSLADAHERIRTRYDPERPAPFALAWLFDLLSITPAEIVYLLRYYYADIPEVAETDQYWGLGGRLYQFTLEYPFKP